MNKLIDFIIQAKMNGYASKGEGGESSVVDGGKMLEYRLDNLYYRDIYYGFDPFIGQEIVYEYDIAIWGMNFMGTCIEGADARAVYAFLKECLKKVEEDMPYRGPKEYSLGGYRYVNKAEGSMNGFQGEERIYYNDQEVYKLRYGGGIIK